MAKKELKIFWWNVNGRPSEKGFPGWLRNITGYSVSRKQAQYE
jgi:hypothetical protein